MRKSHFALASLCAAAALFLVDRPGAQTCTSTAAPRGLLASSFLDTALNVPDGEDTEFFTRSSGMPNIFFLLDSSGSMTRLAPNGPSYYPGTYPPLKDENAAANDGMKDFNVDCTNPRTDKCAIVGCGDDVESAPYAGASTLIKYLQDRPYFSPCGNSQTSGLIGTSYQQFHPAPDGATPTDYAYESGKCDHWSSGGGTDHAVNGDPGYDPDWYCGSTGGTTSCTSGSGNFFDKDLVFHDTIVDGPPAGAPSDGWTDRSVNPYRDAANTVTTIDGFCESLYAATVQQGTGLKRDICKSCLKKRGFFVDGRMFRQNQEGRTDSPAMPVPSIWYSGNYLNMYPPKFLVARKVMKDIIMGLSKVRSGLAHFGGGGADHTNQQWQDFQPTCGHPESSFDSSRKTYMDTIDRFRFTGGTPLARALLDVGQYYHSPALPWWGPDTTWNGSDNATQASICFACQNSSVIVLTDGLPKSGDDGPIPVGGVTAAQQNALYAGDSATGIAMDASGSFGIPTMLCPRCNDFPLAEDWKNNPTRVAWYLHNMDLRKNGETTLDCQGNGGRQTVNVYTVGFSTQYLPGANTMLSNAAAMGGGFFVNAENAPALKDGINSILKEIDDRSTSFSVATVSTLQTTAGHSVIIPRFEPAKTAHWRGHLYRYELYSEFLNPCTETADGSGTGDLDCDGKCQSVFLMDSDGDFIQEDADGILRKDDPPTQVSCIQAPQCEKLGRACAAPGTAVARAWWDAQAPLSSSAWSTRKVYTVVDSNGDGQVDAADGVLALDTTDATATAIAKYLPLGNGTACDKIATKVSSAGDTATAAQIRASPSFCVKTIIRYVLGADVFNEKGATVGTTWPQAATDAGQNLLPDRDFKLGDIFHSSPVVVDPPPPPDGVLCPNGLHNQCLTSLWRTPVQSDPPGTNAYGIYAGSTQYKNRRKVVLVGANDGLLHAFDGGTWHDKERDDFTWAKTSHQVDTSKPPFNGYYDRGTGAELWAFVPPDLLAKLPLFLGSAHQLYVDGSPMVRDVWVDGSQNELHVSTAKDGKKQSWEFHTVAVVAERRGGTHYFALDVTDANQLATATDPTKPKFLWIFPQPSSVDSLRLGETYNDYLPVGPPIGPVRLESTMSGAPTVVVPGVTDPVPFEERWVTFLSGGFDAQYVRGRGVYMVDVWTGQKIWDFTYPASSADATAGDVRLSLKAPIPATVGMVMWGSNERRQRQVENDGYFDTATFGDAGGQLWVLRFGRPGPTDWTGARVMEMPGCTNQPFFYLTANVPVSGGIYRVLAGTGDRFNLLDTSGGTCGPDNLRACIQRGCTVKVPAVDVAGTSYNQFSAPGLGSVTATLDGSTCTPTTASSTGTTSTCDVFGGARVEISACPSPDPANGLAESTKDYQMKCTDTATGLSCAYVVTPAPGKKLSLSNTTHAITQPNWYFSLRVFEDGPSDRKIFWDEASAKKYDAARLTITSTTSASTGIVLIDGNVDNPTTLSTADGKGWAMYYNHGPSITVADHTYPVSPLDERTSSTSAVYGGVFWNATQPASGASSRANTTGKCPNVALCTMENRRLSYHYGADPTTGGPMMRDLTGNAVRSFKSTTLVPTMGDQPTVFVNQKGQVQVGLTAVNPEKGATNISRGQTLDPAPTYGFTEVSRDAHACRHAADAAAAAVACPK